MIIWGPSVKYSSSGFSDARAEYYGFPLESWYGPYSITTL